MRRREFIAGLGTAAAWSVGLRGAQAQQPTMPVIGYLAPGSADGGLTFKRDFLKGLGEAGFIEGRNVAIEYRYARDVSGRLPELAADLVRRRVDVIAALANAGALAAKAATSTIPIVFSIGGDPVALGLVASLSRPGGNLTGASFLTAETTVKLAEMLHELVPDPAIAALLHPASPTRETQTRELQQAARSIGVKLDVLTAANEHDIDAAFATLVERRARALIIVGDALFNDHAKRLAALTLRLGIAAVYPTRVFPDAGGLMSYGGSVTDAQRIAGFYTGRILKGEKPPDLPVQQGTKVALVINLNTAKALGLNVPLAILLRADEVIE
jgi:putative ABC transport system substrate-binding protein